MFHGSTSHGDTLLLLERHILLLDLMEDISTIELGSDGDQLTWILNSLRKSLTHHTARGVVSTSLFL